MLRNLAAYSIWIRDFLIFFYSLSMLGGGLHSKDDILVIAEMIA